MAQPIEFKPTPSTPAGDARRRLEAAPSEHAEALLKAYDLLDTANRHGILDILRGAISAEDAVLDKIAGYANTPEGIAIMRNLLVLGKLLGSVDPGLLSEAAGDLTATVVLESRKPPQGIVSIGRRLFGADARRGLAIAISALESLGKTARIKSQQLGQGK